VTGKVGIGEVGDAFIYTRDSDRVHTLRREYDRLMEEIKLRGHDAKLRAKLGLT
jgi:hypothetical protein